MKRSILLATLCTAAFGATPGAGPAGGRMVGQIYCCGTFGRTPEEMADAGVTLVSSFPWSLDLAATRAGIDRCHELGIRVLPYVSAEKAWDDFDKVQQRNSAGSIPYYRAVSPSHDRDWVLIGPEGRGVIRYGHWLPDDESGTLRPVWGGDPPNPGAWYMCPHVAGYVEAVLKGVCDTIAFGADGLFIDNVDTGRFASVGEDHGPDLGRRGHLDPHKNISQAYTELVRRMADQVRARGPDKIVMLNSGREPAFADVRDGAMLESFIYTGGDRRIHAWQTVAAWQKELGDEVAHGRVVAALPYIGHGRDRPGRDMAFHAFAAAKYCDFLYGAVNRTGRPLVRLRIGRATGPAVDRDGVAWRVCRRGVVVVNHSDQDRRLPVPAPEEMVEVCDFYAAAIVPANDGHFVAEVPADSGRVYASPRSAMDAYLGEAVFYLRRRFETDGDAEKQAVKDRLQASIADIRGRLKEGRDISEVRPDVLRLVSPVEGEPKFRLAQAASLAAGVRVSADPLRKPLVPGGSVGTRVAIVNTSAWPVSMRFRKPGTPAGYSVEVPQEHFTVAPHCVHQAAITLRRAAGGGAPDRQRFVQFAVNLGCRQGSEHFGLMTTPAAGLGKAVELAAPDPSVCLLDEARRPLSVRLSNRTSRTVAGRLTLAAPEGWQAPPPSVEIKASGTGRAELALTPPAGAGNRMIEAPLILSEPLVKGKGDESLAYVPGTGDEASKSVTLARETVRLFAVPGLVVRPTGRPTKLDGRLDDACWRDAAKAEGLLSYMPTGRPAEDSTLIGPQPAVARTEVHVTYDDEALYVGFRCRRETMDNLRMSFRPDTPGRNMGLWRDDHVECYLDPGRKLEQAVQLMVNPAGAVRDLGGATWRWAAAVVENDWSVEMAFPFSNTGSAPKPGERWGANFVRFDYGGTRVGKNERSEWSCTFEGPRSPHKFGVLLFSE